jgi:hypothetical protein
MSAISKQPSAAPQAKSPSAAALLACATKKGKATSHLLYTGEAGREAAARWLELDAKLSETERELGLVREQILDVVRPWHEETCARRRAHESTVVVETPTGALRVSFQHRYTKLPLDPHRSGRSGARTGRKFHHRQIPSWQSQHGCAAK